MLSEGLKIASTLKDYIDFLKSNDQRIMISPWDYQMLKKIKYNIKEHKLANKLLSNVDEAAELTDLEAHHEFHINWEWYGDEPNDDYPHVSCKSLLDSLTLDFKNKKATIMDLKTTAKLWHFEESIEMYDYLRQLCYYMQAVNWYLKTERNEDPTGWKFDFYIIGIDTTGSNEIRVFRFTMAQMLTPFRKIHDALSEILWHQVNNKWEHRREYYEGDGSETLNL